MTLTRLGSSYGLERRKLQPGQILARGNHVVRVRSTLRDSNAPGWWTTMDILASAATHGLARRIATLLYRPRR